MIPAVVFYVLASALVGFGGWRIILSRRPDEKRKRYHLVWGLLYLLVGLWLILTQSGVIPPPRLSR